MKIITLCGKGGCCPKLTIPSTKDKSFADDDKFTITDDDGGQSVLTWVQLQELRNTINKL